MSSASVHSSTPLYTVEQLELIRRLKNSGINKDDIISAFDSFEKVDKDLGPVYNIPVALALQAQALQLMAFNLGGTSGLSTSSASQLPALKSSISSQSTQIPVPLSIPKLNIQPSENSSVEIFSNSFSKSFISQDAEVDTKDFLDFVSQGDAACCEEIRAFAAKHNIKQQQIATLAGICQSYVSRYMKGDIYDMSERSRRAIQKWYLLYRKNPASIDGLLCSETGIAANAAMHIMNSNSNGNLVKKLINPASIDLSDLSSQEVSFPRRERFVFRPNHLEILEKYFQDNNYPSYETREEIAQACNVVTETAG